jgi:methylenetetrahydrofolate dehydrogenase (NADP+)/methenyltetrahydrofolate cyclohydrolase
LMPNGRGMGLETRILKGRPIAAGIEEEVRERAARVRDAGGSVRLVVVLVGDDPGSKIYSASILKAASRVGIAADITELSVDARDDDIAGTIRRLSDDTGVSGIIVQRPLPPGTRASVVDEIAPTKDIDCATTINMGALMTGRGAFAPITARSVLEILTRSEIAVAGRHVVIVGRSNVVGRPLAALLLRKADTGNATVTVCHTGTTNLAEHTRRADILVAAMGRPEGISADMVTEGVVVVDVGVNRVDDPESERGYRIVGDVAYDGMLGKAAAITPVPGGVGALTTALLLRSTVEAAELGEDEPGVARERGS